MKKITGSIVALVTPFNQDGSADYGRLRELVDWHIANKTDALLVLGTTGETASTSLEDLKALVIRGLKEHLCTPAFARLAAREYGFDMEFQDPEMQRESLDEEELRKVEAYREAIRKDVSEAMRLFGEDHPARSQVNGEEQRRAPERIPKMKAPDYDFSRLK